MMSKKQYQEPKMDVFVAELRTKLLTESEETEKLPFDPTQGGKIALSPPDEDEAYEDDDY
ncbi:MAG: hypothetical protein IJP46_10090 [Prevotella sp.]|nr:hypothetical protein [Prevotella sp.]